VRLDDSADVGGELRVLDLGGEFAAGDEVLDAADAGACLVLPGGDGVAAEAEAAFGGAGAALAECVGDLGLEEAALMPGEAAGCRTEQVVVDLNGDVHRKTLHKDRRVAYERPQPLTSRSPGRFACSERLSEDAAVGQPQIPRVCT
jgi:hypothetical protein